MASRGGDEGGNRVKLFSENEKIALSQTERFEEKLRREAKEITTDPTDF